MNPDKNKRWKNGAVAGLGFAGALVFAAGLAGCGGGNEDPTDGGETNNDGSAQTTPATNGGDGGSATGSGEGGGQAADPVPDTPAAQAKAAVDAFIGHMSRGEYVGALDMIHEESPDYTEILNFIGGIETLRTNAADESLPERERGEFRVAASATQAMIAGGYQGVEVIEIGVEPPDAVYHLKFRGGGDPVEVPLRQLEDGPWRLMAPVALFKQIDMSRAPQQASEVGPPAPGQ